MQVILRLHWEMPWPRKSFLTPAVDQHPSPLPTPASGSEVFVGILERDNDPGRLTLLRILMGRILSSEGLAQHLVEQSQESRFQLTPGGLDLVGKHPSSLDNSQFPGMTTRPPESSPPQGPPLPELFPIPIAQSLPWPFACGAGSPASVSLPCSPLLQDPAHSGGSARPAFSCSRAGQFSHASGLNLEVTPEVPATSYSSTECPCSLSTPSAPCNKIVHCLSPKSYILGEIFTELNCCVIMRC